MSFELEGGGFPVMAKVGAPRTAFLGPVQPAPACGVGNSSLDMPNQSMPVDVGCFFLTDDGLVGTEAPPAQSLIIRYSIPVRKAGGYVLDMYNELRGGGDGAASGASRIGSSKVREKDEL